MHKKKQKKKSFQQPHLLNILYIMKISNFLDMAKFGRKEKKGSFTYKTNVLSFYKI